MAKLSQNSKLAIDFAPLLAFFVAFRLYGLEVATAVLLGTTAISVALMYACERKVAWMPLMSALLVGVMGGLTIWFNDERFIKSKPTLVSAIFALVLLGGALRRKATVKYLFGQTMRLSDAGWQALTWRWGLFFLVLAVANELVWRNFTTETWVQFKVFGILGLTIAFTLSQMPLIRRHGLDDDHDMA